MTMQAFTEFSDVSNAEAPVRGYLHRATGSDGLVLTHGAGADSRSALLVALADAFCAAGLTVLRCDLPFRQSRSHGPPLRGSAERDQRGLRAAVEAMRGMIAGRIFLGGHSYGGRQASILAASGLAAGEPQLMDGLLLLSYPLHPPKEPLKLRTAHFPALQVPALFVHGARDGFGSISEMESALSLIPARTELMTVAGAGHELLTRNNRDELMKQVTSGFLAFTRLTT